MKCILLIATIAAPCLASAPRAAAQTEVPRVVRLGMLSDLERFGNPVSPPPPDWLASFRSGLRDSGYEEGKNIRFEFRNGDRDPEKLAKMAAELAVMKVDVIVASSTTAAKAAKAATHAIPIVFWGAEPISSGLVANLDHPGENLTGVTANEQQETEFLAMLKEVVAGLNRVAILFNRSYAPVTGLLKNAESGARALGLSTQLVEVTTPGDLPGAFAAMKREGSRAVLVVNHGMFFRERAKLAALAIENRIAVSSPYLPNGEAGALIAHEPDFDLVWRLNASYVDKILKGANPGDLPVQRLAAFRYAINLNTAKALGLIIPASILKRAAVVIPDSAPANAEPGAQPAASESDCNQPAPTPLTTVDLPGHPFSIVSSRDGCWLFVSLTSEDPKSNGVAVLRRAAGTITLERVYPIEGRKGRNPMRAGPSGMVMSHDGQLLIAANDDDLVFFDVQSVISGKSDPVLGHLSDGAPKRTVLTSNGWSENSAGSCYVNVTKDDARVFVSDEYAGTISVVDLAKARRSNYDPSAIVGRIPVGVAPIALTFSPDERWLYTTSQRASASWNWPVACPPDRQDRAAFPKLENPEGAIIVVDVSRARTEPVHSIVATVPAGCGPVRLAITPDGGSIWVSARRSDAVLGFDTRKLVNDPSQARIGSVPVGTAPVGIAALPDGKHIVVANSNRIAANPNSPQNVSVIDTQKVRAGATAVIGTFPAGAFPREFSLSPDGRTLFLGNYLSNTLEVIDVKRLFDIVQTSAKKAAPEAVGQQVREIEQQIRELEEERRQAVLHNDTKTLDQKYADGMTAIDIAGAFHTNSDKRSVNLNSPGTRTTKRWVSDEMIVRIYGDTAVVTQRAQIEDLLRGQSRSFSARLTHVWAKVGGRWQLVARHGTEIAEPETYGRARPGPSSTKTPSPHGEETSEPRAHSQADQEVLAVEEQMETLQRSDNETRIALWAEDLIYVGNNGVAHDKGSLARAVSAGEVKTEFLDVTDRKVRTYGDTAVVTAIEHRKASFHGKEVRDLVLRYTRVWVRRNDKWQVVSFQETRITAP